LKNSFNLLSSSISEHLFSSYIWFVSWIGKFF